MARNMLFPDFKLKAVTLSYDDGVGEDIRLVEIMREHGLKGTFNVNTGRFKPEACVYEPNKAMPVMSLEQAVKLYEENGMEMAVHSISHPCLDTLPLAEATQEVLLDKAAIEKATGKICRGMAYPYGAYNDDVVNILKCCGILYARTTASRMNFEIPNDWLRLSATCHHSAPELMTLAKDFVKANYYMPHMFYLWGHSYEFQRYDDRWHIIEEFAEFIGGKDEIWYATNIEIFEYMEAYKRLQASCDGHIVYNPTAIPVYFNQFGKKVCLKPGETVEL